MNTLYIANKMKLKNEMYFALLLDRGTMGPMIIACSEGRGPARLLRDMQSLADASFHMLGLDHY